MSRKFRSGYVSIAGRPNVGKSTLLNRVLGEKIAIISQKPNTTRNRILGIKNTQKAQIIFLDTPGIHTARKQLNRYMVREALRACGDADLILLMIEATRPWQDEDFFTLKNIARLGVPAFLLINKIDRVGKPSLLPLIEESQRQGSFKEIFPISALTGDGVDELVDTVLSYLPEGPAYFPEDLITDQAERFLAAETVREKVFALTEKEVPYSTAVTIEEFKEGPDIVRISALIHVERDSQKGILIGKKGAMLKKIGTLARKELEGFLAQRVFLKLFVRVEKDWTRNPETMRKLGYKERT
jgi:GTP-binding protein Era